ncbi:uncharacterized protein HKBW3S42_02537, partial [Candidatus Hakubella thermalkaliphila]
FKGLTVSQLRNIIHIMNDSHSELESKYKPRWVAPLLRGAIEDHPVVVLSGARQVGKSTLLQNESPFPAWRYITFYDIDVLGPAEADPASRCQPLGSARSLSQISDTLV